MLLYLEYVTHGFLSHSLYTCLRGLGVHPKDLRHTYGCFRCEYGYEHVRLYAKVGYQPCCILGTYYTVKLLQVTTG